MNWVLFACVGFGLTLVTWGIFTVTALIGSRPGAKRNAWAGIRIPSTMKSDEAWVAGHAIALWHARQGSIAILPVGALLLFFLQDAVVIAILEWVLFIITVTWIFIAVMLMNRVAKEANNHSS
jgi:hypothetical protein